jgi:putative ABC transport system permease protein
MLKNYFKIAIAVLKRRKFFTFISLFGISFTLTILIVLTAFVDNVLRSSYPEVNRDRCLYINLLQQKSSKHGFSSNNPASYYYLDHYVNTLKTPEAVAISTLFASVNAYVNNKKLVVNTKYTNAAWWDVLRFQFLEGKPYTQQEIDNAEHVAVISEDLKKEYFGDIPAVVGKYIEVDNVQYRVAGVVKSVPITMPLSYGDFFAPYTVSKTDFRDKALTGTYNAIILARSKADLPKIQQEYQDVVAKIKPENKDFDLFVSHADGYLASFTRIMFGSDENSGIDLLIIGITIFVLLFMLLPTLNLININISRILERSSEIGVRKAFGASSRTLVWQFIVENIILTVFGAAIGLLFSFIIIQLVNNSDFITNLHLSINLTVLFSGIVACLLFGLLSGVYPAWRMSRLEVVTALKTQ